jgi:hypothetical protein
MTAFLDEIISNLHAVTVRKVRLKMYTQAQRWCR